MSQVSLVIQETGVPLVFLALEIQDLVERKVSRVSQEDRDLLVHQELRVNLVRQRQRKGPKEKEVRMASLGSLVHQVYQVSLDSLVFLVYRERRVNPESQALDCQDLQDQKDSQVLPGSQEPLEDQEDQE